jgi:hypothetical protein
MDGLDGKTENIESRRGSIMNTATLTGKNINDLEINDRYYVQIKDKTWLFSLTELDDMIQNHDGISPFCNPYTLEPIDENTMNLIQQAIEARAIANPGVYDENTSSTSLMTRSGSFNISNKITEFLFQVSHLGCYPDVNAFKRLEWRQILRFLKKLTHDWPDLRQFLYHRSSDNEINQSLSQDQNQGQSQSQSQNQGQSLSQNQNQGQGTCTVLTNILRKANTQEEITKEDQKAVIRFLIRIVNQKDGNDSSRALLFTTELAAFLEQLNRSEHEANSDLEENGNEEHNGSELYTFDNYETILAHLRSQPDRETFLEQMRFIIEHIVDMNTYSLSNSLHSNNSAHDADLESCDSFASSDMDPAESEEEEMSDDVEDEEQDQKSCSSSS